MRSLKLFIQNLNYISCLLKSFTINEMEKNKIIDMFDKITTLKNSKLLYNKLKIEYGKERNKESFV